MENPSVMKRSDCDYNTSSKKYLKKLKFKNQFFKIYQIRLKELTKRLTKRINGDSDLGEFPIVTKLSEITEGEPCVIIGTIVKSMKFKPNILENYSANKIVNEKEEELGEGGKRISDDDSLLLEDMGYERVKLFHSVDRDYIGKLVNGVVVGVMGVLNAENGFDFTNGKIITAGYPPIRNKMNDDRGTKFVAFISGIGINKSKNYLGLQLVMDYLSGSLCSKEENEKFVSKITRLIVVGNSIHPPEMKVDTFVVKGSLQAIESESPVQDMRILDEMFSHLAQNLSIDLMPGKGDPTNRGLPQQPIHRCMLKKCFPYQTFTAVTNPHEFEIDGLSFLGTSGQNIDAIREYSTFENSLEIMSKTLEWNHLSPTAPDTMICYPSPKEDDLILNYSPNVFFTGCQKEFARKMVNEDVLFLSIPSFHLRPCIVLLNLENFETMVRDFTISC